MPYLISLLTLALMIFAMVDIIVRDQSLIKHLPKFLWLIIVILLPLIGSILWFALGREYAEGSGPQVRRPAPRPRSRMAPAPAVPPAPSGDTRSTEQQLADLEKEIEEDRLRAEIARRRAQEGGASAS